jgi:putative membrane-bound dehydrogenase-like protein
MKKLLLLLTVSMFSFIADQNHVLNEDEYAKLTETEKRSTKHALDGIDLKDPELDITLFASEPMMTNPTNMDIDAKGRVWICEAFNYRNALNPKNPYKPKGDRILIMEDTNHDGVADTSKVFYQGEDINAALGIAVLGNKTYVSCSPNVFVFTDENGDDIPDKKEIMFTGIAGNQHDHGMHAFVFGPDGKLYFNFGNAGEGLMTKDGKPIYDANGNIIKNEGKPYREGMVYRSDIDGSNVEILGWNFRNNYELAVDSYGRMWQSDNDDDGNKATRINYVMDYGNYGYKDEMTGADWRVRRTNMEDSVFQKHWHLNDPGVVPNILQTYAGSPTGILFYEGNLLPKQYQNQIIHCDAGPNIVRAYPTVKTGAGFKASIINILDGAKKDKWFRPSDVTTAPDGSIFVADWYDPGVGGHAMGDSTRGRIYRIAPKNVKYNSPKYDFSDIKSSVEALKNPNQSIRFLAYSALKQMGEKTENALKELAMGTNPTFAARAYWLLADINSHYVEHASKQENEDLRVMSVRLARKIFKNPEEFYLEMAADKSPQVRREVALAIRHKKYDKVWGKLFEGFDGNDRWYLEALGIAANNQWDQTLEWLQKNKGDNWLNDSKVQDVVWRSRGKNTSQYLGHILLNSTNINRNKLYRAFDFQDTKTKNVVLLKLIKNTKSVEEKVIIFKHLDQKSIVTNPIFLKELPILLNGLKNKLDYVDIVNKYQIKNQFNNLHKLVMTDTDYNVVTAATETVNNLHGTKGLLLGLSNPKNAKKALEKYGDIDDAKITDVLISTYQNNKLSIDVRETAMREMTGWKSEEILWKQYNDNKIPDDVVEIAKGILKRTWHSDIRNEITKREEKITKANTLNIEKILAMSTDKAAGKETFNLYCTTCHKVNEQGIDFGPGLSQIGAKLTKQSLLNSIINPSEGISFGYEGSIIYMKDNSSFQAVITSKTENELMIKYPGQANISTIKRKDVEFIDNSPESLMPKFGLSENELANLVGYLETLK